MTNEIERLTAQIAALEAEHCGILNAAVKNLQRGVWANEEHQAVDD
jgi:hypothetical protein